jgi:hypothetical protein
VRLEEGAQVVADVPRPVAGRRLEHVAHPVCPAEHVQRVHAQLGRPAHVRVDPVADHDDALGRLVGRLPVHDRLGLADRRRDGAGHGGDHVDERAVRRNQSPFGRNGDVEVRGDQPRPALDGDARLGEVAPPHPGTEADQHHGGTVVRGCDRRRPDLAQGGEHAVATDGQHVPAGELLGDEPRGRDGRGHDVAGRGRHPEPAEVVDDRRRGPRRVVGDEGDADTVAPHRLDGLVGAGHDRPTAVDHAVEVEEHVPVADDQRSVRTAQTRHVRLHPGRDLLGRP